MKKIKKALISVWDKQGILELANFLVQNDVEILLCLGDEDIESYIDGWEKEGGNMKSVKQFTNLDDLLNAFKKELKPGDVVLVKGSRSAHMERFVENFR